jgi:SAM-dependent methyltransferase
MRDRRDFFQNASCRLPVRRWLQSRPRHPSSPALVLAVTLCLSLLEGHRTNRSGLCEGLTLLAKSKETFKLAELQLLEAKIQFQYPSITDIPEQSPRFNLTRLLIDRSTGSSLFQLEAHHSGHCSHEFLSTLSFVSSLKRCDWMGVLVASAHNAKDFLNEIHCLPLTSIDILGRWTLDYVRMEATGVTITRDPNCTAQSKYTMKSLLCSVSHALPCPPALDPTLSDDRLLIVDTVKSLYLIRTIPPSLASSRTAYGSQGWKLTTTFDKLWARRPFQYSSAINTAVAEIVMEILGTLSRHQYVDSTNQSTGVEKLPVSRRRLLDPTCGSGTFLALAIANGFQVEGYDINPTCVVGSLRNLEFVFSKDVIHDYASVNLADSSLQRDIDLSTGNGKFDCVVANLPWGRNSVEFVDENRRILCSVRARIDSGIPCAFITGLPSSEDLSESGNAKVSLSTSLFATTGFAVLGQACVPQREFALPNGKKNKKREKSMVDINDKELGENEQASLVISSADVARHNQCVITIALSAEVE